MIVFLNILLRKLFLKAEYEKLIPAKPNIFGENINIWFEKKKILPQWRHTHVQRSIEIA